MNKDKVLEPCKYYNNGNCVYRREFGEKLDAMMSAGIEPAALQPRCPKDAQRNNRGLLACVCERGKKLC